MAEGIGAAGHGNVVLYAALAANVGIGIAKFVAAGITGSSSMLTEGIHSCVDSGNEILLLYGQRAAGRGPDRLHPFGYGRELYFWAFVVAILIFAVGAGLSVLEGLEHIHRPERLVDPLINYIVLAVSFLLEGTSWLVAVRQFGARKGRRRGWWRAIHDSKDPPGFIVLFEDSAALIGLVVAALGVWASHRFDQPRLDGAASIVIGLILGGVAILLAREAKGLLIGEGAEPRVIGTVRRTVAGWPGIAAVNDIRTIHTSPDKVFVAISADFDGGLTIADAETMIERIEDRLRAEQPILVSIYIRPERREHARGRLPFNPPA